MTPARIHHTGVVVRSTDDALLFFRDQLGLALLADEAVPDQGVRAALLALGNPALSGAEGPALSGAEAPALSGARPEPSRRVEGSFLELLEPTVADTGIARYLERRGEGLHHVCLEVPDIEAELVRLKAQGVPLVDETPRAGLTGTIAFLHPSALHGVLVELVHGPSAYRSAGVQGQGSRANGAAGSGGGIVRLDHLVLACEDLDAAARAWLETLGLRAEPPYSPPGSRLQLARLPFEGQGPRAMGEGSPAPAREPAFLELIAMLDDDAATRDPRPATHRLARFLAERGEGMFSISLEVGDLDAAVARLRARGVTVSHPETGAWPDTRLARIPRASAHGVAIQLIER